MIINRKDTSYYSEGLIIDKNDNLQNENIQKADLEDIIYYYGKEIEND